MTSNERLRDEKLKAVIERLLAKAPSGVDQTQLRAWATEAFAAGWNAVIADIEARLAKR